MYRTWKKYFFGTLSSRFKYKTTLKRVITRVTKLERHPRKQTKHEHISTHPQATWYSQKWPNYMCSIKQMQYMIEELLQYSYITLQCIEQSLRKCGYRNASGKIQEAERKKLKVYLIPNTTIQLIHADFTPKCPICQIIRCDMIVSSEVPYYRMVLIVKLYCR